MKKYLLFIVLAIQCSQPVPYDPVDWKSPPPTKQDPAPQQPPTIQSTEIQQLLILHNEQRELKGRPGFQLDEELNKYAESWAKNMANRNSLYHSNLDFMKSNRFRSGGENIAWNQKSPQEVTNGWMNSTGHRDNILNRKFTQVGFGVARNKKNEPYWCTVFAGF